MNAEQTSKPAESPIRAPDPILAELWEVKRQINQEAGYRIDELVRMAHEAALRFQQMNKIGQYRRLNVGDGLRVIGFFAGAGGLDLGFDLAGYNVVYATDIDEKSCSTLRENLGGLLSSNTQIECGDIRKIDFDKLPADIDLVIGGPPCQSFSASGRRAGGAPGRLDDRGTLFEAYRNSIRHIKPKAFLFENVRGILGTNKGEDWKAIVAAFQEIGYKISFRILDALDYGAPQQRERMIMVGHTMDKEFLFPRPLFGPDSIDGKPYVTAGQAVALIDDDEDKDNLVLRNGKYAHLLPLVPVGENYLFFTAKRGHPNPVFAYRSRFSDFLYKANPNSQIKTLIASPGKYTGPFHWDNRCFTVKEYMRLQGFPDGYKVVGDRADKIRQIGNSVSPKLSYQLAIAIAKQIFKREVAIELLDKDCVLSFDKRKGKKAANTRELHSLVTRNQSQAASTFRLFDYEAVVCPNDNKNRVANVFVTTKGKLAKITAHADDSPNLFASMRLEIFTSEELLGDVFGEPVVELEVVAFGASQYSVQTMWNAVDDWVIKSSNFHSLFELYGHFTEPHPVFRITEFNAYADATIAVFAKHVAKFENCSKYLPRQHLTTLFGMGYTEDRFVDLVKLLRSYRFDIRCHETNIAIPPDIYMISYPFTLPFGKQMNFSVRKQLLAKNVSLSCPQVGAA
jgi:DNA (cytosine-5)-methyltransferase 1